MIDMKLLRTDPDLVRENMEGKLQKMPENVQRKLQEAVRRITNDGSGGLICIII